MRVVLVLIPILVACGAGGVDLGDSPTSKVDPTLGFDPENPTWVNPISGMVRDNCLRCHVTGQLGTYRPFEDYTYVAQYAGFMYTRLADLSQDEIRMPPYLPGPTSDCLPEFADHRDLSVPPELIDAFATWMDQGAPYGEGEPVEMLPPPIPALPGASTYPFQEGFEIRIRADQEGNMRDDYACVIVDPDDLPHAGLWAGMQPLVDVDHLFRGATVRLDPDRASLALVGPASPRAHGSAWYECSEGFGFDGPLVASFLPGSDEPPGVSPAGDEPSRVVAFEAPAGTAVALPEGALLVVRWHYHAHHDNIDFQDQSPVEPLLSWVDRSSLTVRWVEPSEVDDTAVLLHVGNHAAPVVDGEGLETPPFAIPPAAGDPEYDGGHPETMVGEVPGGPGDAWGVFSVEPGMRLAGSQVAVRVARAAGGDTCLAAVPEWDPSWQAPVIYPTPAERAVAAASDQMPVVYGGDRIEVTCRYQNPSNNVTIPLGTDGIAEQCEATVGLVPLR